MVAGSDFFERQVGEGRHEVSEGQAIVQQPVAQLGAPLGGRRSSLARKQAPMQRAWIEPVP